MPANKILERVRRGEKALGLAMGSYTDELVELSGQVAELGGIYHSHVRYRLGDRFLDPFREALEIGTRSGVPVHITHF